MKLYTTQSQANRLISLGLPLRTADLFTSSQMMESGLTPLFKDENFWFDLSSKFDDPDKDIFQLWSLGQLMFLYDKMFPRELMSPFNCIGHRSMELYSNDTNTANIDPVEVMVRQLEYHNVLSSELLSRLDLVNEDLPEKLAEKIMTTRKLNGVPLNIQCYFKELNEGML